MDKSFLTLWRLLDEKYERDVASMNSAGMGRSHQLPFLSLMVAIDYDVWRIVEELNPLLAGFMP